MLELTWDDKTHYLATLAMVALQTSIIQHGKVSDLALDLQAIAISAQRLAVNLGGLSDVRVLTAIVILSNSYALGRGEDVMRQFDVLPRFVEERGGLHTFGLHGFVAEFLQYKDHV